jgi:hypothetical protein
VRSSAQGVSVRAARKPSTLIRLPVVPEGTTIISGHFSHSLNTSLGFSACSSAADNGHATREDRDTVAGALAQGLAGGAEGGATTATCVFGAEGEVVALGAMLPATEAGGSATATWLFFNS